MDQEGPATSSVFVYCRTDATGAVCDERDLFRLGMASILEPVLRHVEPLRPEDVARWLPSVTGEAVAVVAADIPEFGAIAQRFREHDVALVAAVEELNERSYHRMRNLGAFSVVSRAQPAAHIRFVVLGALERLTFVPTSLAVTRAEPSQGACERCLSLTTLQRATLRCFATGATVAQVAAELHQSERTTQRLLSDTCRLLGASSRAGALVHAARCGILH